MTGTSPLLVFYDTEFLELGSSHPIDLISIGVVTDDGREYYAVNVALDLSQATPWLRQHVIPLLPPRSNSCWKLPNQIRQDLLDLVDHRTPELWANYGAFDHVVLCQLFGGMAEYPETWPKFTRDIQQWRAALGNPELPAQAGEEHDALDDARGVREAWLFLERFAREGQETPIR
ncbi:MAG: 3'-5' exoribonuclease domain-containing protein [Terriglobia bacterium]